MREVEGFDADETMKELKNLFPRGEDTMEEEDESVLPESVPKPIRDMSDSKSAMEALGTMIWYADRC